MKKAALFASLILALFASVSCSESKKETKNDTETTTAAETATTEAASTDISAETSTGAAEAVAKALPQLKGKLTGMAMRVPTATGSVVVLDVELNANVSPEDINRVIETKMDNESISGTFDPVVSSDIIGCEYGSYVDFQSTKVLDTEGETTMAQIVSWYDNEASYTHQYVKTLIHWLGLM